MYPRPQRAHGRAGRYTCEASCCAALPRRPRHRRDAGSICPSLRRGNRTRRHQGRQAGEAGRALREVGGGTCLRLRHGQQRVSHPQPARRQQTGRKMRQERRAGRTHDPLHRSRAQPQRRPLDTAARPGDAQPGKGEQFVAPCPRIRRVSLVMQETGVFRVGSAQKAVSHPRQVLLVVRGKCRCPLQFARHD